MSETKVAAIFDKSEAYVAFQKDRLLSRWGVSMKDVSTVETLKTSGGLTLFGDTPTSLLSLSEPDQVKKLVEDLNSLSPERWEELSSSGLIITCNVNRTQTKKLEATLKAKGATVVTPPGKGDEPLAQKLVGELHLTPAVRNFLLSYVGDDYDSLIPLVESLSKLPKKQHLRITEEDIYIRLPQPPGAVAPWSIEQPLLRGEMTKVIDIFRRTHQHTHLLVVLATLKNKFQLTYRIAALTALNPRISDAALAEALGVANNYPFKLARGNAKKYGLDTMVEVVKLLATTEAKVKGASAADSVVLMEATLVELCELFSRRASR